MAVELTPLGFKKPDGNELVRNGDNVIADNAQKSQDLHQAAQARFALLENAAGFPGAPLDFADTVVESLVLGPSDTSDALNGKYAQVAHLPVNVKQLGVTGNGATDDRPLLQSIITAAGANATLYFPPGTYLLSTATVASDRILVVPAGQKWIGSGSASTIKVANNFGAYKTIIGCTNDSTDVGSFTMERLRFDQNSGNGNTYLLADLMVNTKHVLRVLSFTAGSSILIRDCIFDNSDCMNTLYIAADTIDISRNLWRGTGTTGGGNFRDHSSIYTTTTVEGGTQTIINNTFRGNLGMGSSVCAIETHGGSQTVTGNNISGYMIGANLTGWSSTVRCQSIVFNNNPITNCAFGIQVWSRYSGTITTGPAMTGVEIHANPIIVDRDSWLPITGISATSWAICVEEASTAPIDGLNISQNQIRYKPSVLTPPANDARSVGIRLVMAYAAAVLNNVKVLDNTIVNPLSSGMHISGIFNGLEVRGNRVVDPAQSTHSSVVDVYRSAGVISGTLNDATFENNTLVDTRATHYCAYFFIALSAMTAANNFTFRNNSARFADGATPYVSIWPSSTAGCAPYIQETVKVWPGVFQPSMAGSNVRESSTGRVYTQVTAPSGTSWKLGANNGMSLTTTTPTAGSAAALPATPEGYMLISVNGVDRKQPYYPV